MRIGVQLPHGGQAASAAAIREAAVAAEESHFADVWVADHVVHPVGQEHNSPRLFDPLLTLTWAAAATTTIGVGTSVLVLPQYHPLWLASVTSSLDVLSGGRLKLGVGVGWSEAEFRALGQDFHTRGRRTDEILEILSLCWSTDPVSYQGTFYDFCDIEVQPKPEHEIEIWIGGSSQAAFQRAQRFGSGFQLIGVNTETIVEAIRRLRADHPDPESYTIGLRALWDTRRVDPEVILREKQEFAAAGVQYIICNPAGSSFDSWIRSMELLAELLIDSGSQSAHESG